jgi:PKD domain
MTRAAGIRRLASMIVLSLVALPFLQSSAGATGTDVCSDTPRVASSFCITYQASIGPNLDARAPFDTNVTFSNTSDSHQTDQAKWLDSIKVQLSSSNTTAPGVIPSANLPNNLVIAGDDGDCAEPFTTCEAGHGVFVFNVTGTTAFNGDHTGTFGILRILNVKDTPPGTFRYQVDIQFCGNVPPFGSCAVSSTQSIPVSGPIPQGTGSVEMTIPVFEQGTQMIGVEQAQYEGTVDSGQIHLDGTSDTIHGGPTQGSFDVFTLPPRCGTVGGSGSFSTHENTPRTVRIPQQDAVIGSCPTGAFTPRIQGSTVAFDARASAAHVTGRTVASWRWAFGDGRHLTKTVPTLSHAYPASPATARDYTVSLVVVDSAGAIGAPVTATIHGTAVAINPPQKSPSTLKVGGKVTPFLAGKSVTVVLQRKNGATFHAVGTKTLTLNPASSFTAAFSPRPAAGFCRAVVRFTGDATHLGSSQTKTFSC